MDRIPLLNVKSLKEQVHEYLREQMRSGEFRPGMAINMGETSKKLGISKTPLREALLQLEIEDFVTIRPRRMIVVNDLTEQDIHNYYECIGAPESMALLKSVDWCGNAGLVKMVATLKKRLYDFPRLKGFVKAWEQSSIRELQALIDLLRAGLGLEAANHIRNIHWSFEVHAAQPPGTFVAASAKQDGIV